MGKINHNRPYLRYIDNLRKVTSTKERGVGSTDFSWENLRRKHEAKNQYARLNAAYDSLTDMEKKVVTDFIGCLNEDAPETENQAKHKQEEEKEIAGYRVLRAGELQKTIRNFLRWSKRTEVAAERYVLLIYREKARTYQQGSISNFEKFHKQLAREIEKNAPEKNEDFNHFLTKAADTVERNIINRNEK